MRTVPICSGVLLLVLVCAFSGAAAESGAGANVIELGRQGKAMPWLAQLGGEPYEVVKLSSIPALAGIQSRTAYYEIDPDVVVSGFAYFFYVRGVDNDYMVGSIVKLVKLCRELEVVEELKKTNKGKEFAQGVGDVFVGMGKGLGNLVMHPGVSMKNMGSAFRSIGRSAERAVDSDAKIGVDESGRNRSLLGDGPAGDVRRALAYELGVDVYTDNPVLQKLLTELSQIRELGNLASWAVPYGLTMLDYFNPIAGDAEAEKLIRDNNSYDLRRAVGMDLGRMYGLDREDRGNPLGRLLANPNYTPREIAYIGKDLVSMRDVAGHEIVLRLLADAATPEEADMMSLELRLYSFLHRRVAPLDEFVPFRHFFAATGKDGVFRFVFMGDTVRPWKTGAGAFEELIKAAVATRARGLEVWTTADVDPGLVEKAAQRGVKVHQNIYRDGRFFPGPEQPAARAGK